MQELNGVIPLLITLHSIVAMKFFDNLLKKGLKWTNPPNVSLLTIFIAYGPKFCILKQTHFTIPLSLFCIVDLKSYNDLFEKHSIPEEEAEMWQSTLLQKAAKSTCIVKNTYLLGKVMDAKKKNSMNLYFSK